MCVPVPAACRHAFVGVVLSRACACRRLVNGVSTVAEAVGERLKGGGPSLHCYATAYRSWCYLRSTMRIWFDGFPPNCVHYLTFTSLPKTVSECDEHEILNLGQNTTHI